MAERKTFGNKVGTPRGYVDKAAMEKVDKAMEPVAEVGKELLWLTPMGRAARPAKKAWDAGSRLVRGAKDKLMRSAPKPRAAKDITPDDLRQKTLDGLKQGPPKPRPASDVKPGDLRQKTLDSLKQGPPKPRPASDIKAGDARTKFLRDSGLKPRRPRPGEKKFIGPQNKPQPGDKKFIGPQNKPVPGDKRFIGPSPKPKAGDKNFIGPQNKPKDAPKTFGAKSKVAAGAAAIGGGAALYKAADKSKADMKAAGGARPGERAGGYPAAKVVGGARPGERTSGYPSAKPPVPKAKPAGGSSSGTSKPAKAAGDKSRAAKPVKKFSNFERMKQRQYEKEGYGGRAMTTERAKAQVSKERGSKVSAPSLSKMKSAVKGAVQKATPKAASGMARPQYKSQKARDFAAKLQGQRPSGKAEKKFRFKDLFK